MADATESTVCPHCGAELRQGMLRCRECGRALRVPDRASERPRPALNDVPPDVEPDVEPDAEDVADALETETEDSETSESGAAPRTRFALPRLTRRAALAAGVGIAAAGTGAGWWILRRNSLPRGAAGALAASGERLTCVAFSRDASHVIAGCASGNVVVWEFPGGPPRTLPQQTHEPILSLAVAPDGSLMAGAVEPSLFGWENAIDPARVTPRVQSGFPASIVCIAVRPGKSETVLGLANGAMLAYGRDRKPVRKTSAHANGVRAVAYAPDGGTLVSGGVEGTVVWRSPESLEPLGPPAEMTADVGGLALSPDGRLTVAGDWNGRIEWFDTAMRRPAAQLEQPDAVSAVAVTPNLVVATGWDGALRCWSRQTQDLTTVGTLSEPLVGLALTPDGTRAATVSNDERVVVWRLP